MSFKANWKTGDAGHVTEHNAIGARLNLQFNALDYGAKRDGVTDDTAAIAAAATAAQAVGGVLTLPVGVYAIGDLVFPAVSGLTIRGEGNRAGGQKGTVLRYTGNGAALTLGDGTGQYACHMRDLTIYNASARVSGTGVVALGCNNSTLTDVTTQNFATGVSLQSASKWFCATRLRMVSATTNGLFIGTGCNGFAGYSLAAYDCQTGVYVDDAVSAAFLADLLIDVNNTTHTDKLVAPIGVAIHSDAQIVLFGGRIEATSSPEAVEQPTGVLVERVNAVGIINGLYINLNGNTGGTGIRIAQASSYKVVGCHVRDAAAGILIEGLANGTHLGENSLLRCTTGIQIDTGASSTHIAATNSYLNCGSNLVDNGTGAWV